MGSAIKNEILILEDSEDPTLGCNIEKMFMKHENYSQESNFDDVQIPNLKQEIDELRKTNTNISMEEVINDMKMEVDKIIGDLSETTEPDPLQKLNESERKRKTASEHNDFLNITKLKRLKAEVQDSPEIATTEQKQMCLSQPVVYTTRLDDMKIFQKKIKELGRLYIWEEILRESKPVYNLQRTTNVTPQTSINNLEKISNDIKRINNKKAPKALEKNVEVIDITCPNKNSSLQLNEDISKAFVKRNKKQKVKANAKIASVGENVPNLSTQTIINLNDEVIDLTDVDGLNDKSVEEDIMQIDKMISNKLQELSKKASHKNRILSQILQSPPMYGQSNVNRIESPKEIDEIKSVENNEISKLDTFSPERRKSLQDVVDTTTQENLFPVIYTTRLNDMLVLRNTVKYLDREYILNEILRESKPNVKYLGKQKNKADSISKINFKQLKLKLRTLNRINQEYKISVDTKIIDKPNVFPTEFSCQGLNATENASLLLNLNNLQSNVYMRNAQTKVIEEVDVCQNIALIIQNKFSNQANMFLTNDCGTVTEFRNWRIGGISSNLNDLYKENNPAKKIIRLYTCCWFHTKTNVEKIWSTTATGIARFVQSIHKCLPGNCKCCCKPRRVPGSFKLKFDESKHDKSNKKIKQNDKIKINSLIARALAYRKPKLVERNKKISRLEMGQPIVIETNKASRGDALEYHAINAKGNIDWQVGLYRCSSHSMNDISRLKRLMGNNTSELKYNECNHDWLMCTLKAFDVPFYAIKYIKQPNVLADSIVKYNSPREPDMKLVMDTPFIEHTRKYSEVKLIKIKDILNPNTIVRRGMSHENYVDRVLPSNLLINPEPSTSGLSTHNPPNVNKQPTQPTQPLLLVQPMQPIPSIQTLQPIQAIPPILPPQPVQSLEPIQPKPRQPVLNISKRLIITCTDFPEVETVVDDVTPAVAMQILDQFKNISFRIKKGKLVATLRSLVQSTLTSDFQILAKIVHMTQLKIRDRRLYKDMDLQMNIRCETILSEGSKATIISDPEEAATKVPEEATKTVLEDIIVQNATQTDNIQTANTIMEQFLQNKCSHFSRCISFEKKSYKKSFQLYVRSKEDKHAKTDNIVLPVISNVFSLNDSTSTGVLTEVSKNDFNDSCSSFASSSSSVVFNDVSCQTNLPLKANRKNVQTISELNKRLQVSKRIADNDNEELVRNNNTVINVTPKKDFNDSCRKLSSNSSNVVVINSDANSQTSQVPLPVYPNYVQMTSGQNQFIHLSSKTIVDNTISAMVKNNTQGPGPSNIDLDKLETLIPVNFIIDTAIFNDLMNEASNNTDDNTRQANNAILKSLLEKKTDIVFDNVLHKKK